ncbi:M3 family metallopeptidase [Longimicrobium terrae]|uniref:Peptidyl-dipeptidase Dcp n=1 Tax=Longimicrobium terrae TaxID=1639882 RepID=A0A841H1J3_9BACT|nr:M3 family metallopeptidase [Longimicrobium terrae]MBB4637371.1 peptidyl-dipeptidase Dcp [Longimicrobium terrae]MBB6071769.1 peptidyl-dipeptidase Dcp [Longimicrobium terrae]NNC28529.1 M3 family metallopeptidase [Longimicrobium terrae]
MRDSLITRTAALALAAATAACATVQNSNDISADAPAASAPAPARGSNPLLAPWTGPYGGVPPFNQVRIADFQPAMEAAMAEQLAEIERIASNPAAPTFENTIAAMERAGRTLDRVSTVYGVWSSTMNGPEFQAVEREMAPRLAAFSDQITGNEALFRRIEAVYNSPDKARLTPEQQRLAWLRYTDFVRSGARLRGAQKARLSEINQALAGLYTKFSQNVLKDESEQTLVIDSEAQLAGLPQSLRAAAAAEATSRGMTGKWVISNTRSSIDPFLTYSENRGLRERAWRMFVDRGDKGETDNNATISQILKLRVERANLLGYPTHAHWRLENAMAKTPENSMQLMEAVWTPAVARVRQEVADMQAVANAERANITIEPWDYRFYAEKVRKAKYDLDQNEVKPYLQLDKLREGMFWVAGELFGFQFTPVTDVPVYHPDVTVYRVTDRASGRQIGVWYFDPYARQGKRSGAWMNAYRNQERFDGEVTTIVSNNSNFVKGSAGEPVLISWDDATTLFHEFGHALHGLSSNVNYPTLSGTAVSRDYVEFPSQLLERWLSTPQVLNRFALHYQTGAPIPQALVDRIKQAGTFNQGFATVEYLSSALIDMKLHLAGNADIDPRAFERETLAQLGMPREIVMRHRTPQFGHVFSSDGYSAGYYSYLWSDVLSADAAEAFAEAPGGYYDPEVARRLREYVFQVGNTVDPAEAYRAFRGRDPSVDALMRRRGFPTTSAPAARP